MEHTSHLIKKIEHVKLYKNFTNKDLSNLSGLSESKISRLFKYKNDIKLNDLFLLLDVLDMDNYLLDNNKIVDEYKLLNEQQLKLVNELILALVKK